MWWHVLPRPSFATPPGVGRNQEATKHGPRRIEWRRGTLKHGKGLSSLSSTLAVALLLRIDGKAETDWSYPTSGRAWICEGPPRREVWRAFKVHTEKWISLWSIMRSIHARSFLLPSIGSGIFEFKMGFTVCTNLFHDIAFDLHTDMQIKLRMMCTLCFCPNMWVPK